MKTLRISLLISVLCNFNICSASNEQNHANTSYKKAYSDILVGSCLLASGIYVIVATQRHPQTLNQNLIYAGITEIGLAGVYYRQAITNLNCNHRQSLRSTAATNRVLQSYGSLNSRDADENV